MKQAIQILGMTCQGCRKGWRKISYYGGSLYGLVSLEQASAEFETKEILDVASISAVLGEKYTVDNLNENSSNTSRFEVETVAPFISIWLCNCWEFLVITWAGYCRLYAIFYGAWHCLL